MFNVIVTGGSRGLGFAIATKLVDAGYQVIVIARHEAMQPAAKSIERSDKPKLLHFRSFDLRAVENIPLLVKNLRKEFGPIYALVNNAACGFSGILATMPDKDIRSMVELNTISPIILTKYVVRSMMVDGGGRIINISSIVSTTGYAGLAGYAATKASMIGFTRSLAREIGPLGITVNAIAPGFLDTDMTHGLRGLQRNKVVQRAALRRLAEVDDVASAVEYLISEKAKNITGTVLTVDAGSTA
jgi:3-oxoacyl-[acyl-carrier protein] reductase